MVSDEERDELLVFGLSINALEHMNLNLSIYFHVIANNCMHLLVDLNYIKSMSLNQTCIN